MTRRSVASSSAPSGAWLQLVLGMVAMMAIATPQYTWTLLVEPLRAKLGASLAAVQVTFALVSIFQSGLGPLHGYLASRTSPRLFCILGGLLIGLSWAGSAFAPNTATLYLTYGVLSGVGTGFVYVAVIELMVLYFRENRGFAVGMVAGSYGFGAIVTTFPLAWSLKAFGLQQTLLLFGVGLALVVVLAALGMRRPSGVVAATPSPASVPLSGLDHNPREMLQSPIFWVMFVMMTMVATGGLMVVSQLGPVGASLGVTSTTTVFGMAALPLALTLDRIANGFTRPFFGWVSDHIGREKTMAVAFTLEAVAILSLLKFGSDPLAFVLLSAVVFFGWGEIYSLFPSLQADVFGTRHAVRNFGYLLVGTAIASVLGAPGAAFLVEVTGSWNAVFYAIVALDLVAAFMAIAVLAPMIHRKRAALPVEAN